MERRRRQRREGLLWQNRVLYSCFLPVFYPRLLIDTDMAYLRPRIYLLASHIECSRGARGELSFGSYPRATTHCGVSPLGAIAKRCASALLRFVPHLSQARLSSTSTLLSHTNSTTTEQYYSTDIFCTALSLSRVPSANASGFAPSHRQALRLRLSRLGLVASGRRQSASGRRAPQPAFPP